MRFAKLVASLLFAAALPALAQVEDNLKTVTDLSDTYKQSASKSEAVCILDFTPTARSIYEPYDYLTTGGRKAYLGEENNGQFSSSNFDSTVVSTFWTPYQAKVRGYAQGVAFGLRLNASGDPEVRLFWWPQQQVGTATTGIVDPNNQGSKKSGGKYILDGISKTIIGIPMYTTAAGGVAAVPTPSTVGAKLAEVIAQTSFVRVTVYLSAPSVNQSTGVVTLNGARTIDLPCPWKVWSSPSTVASTAQNYQQNKASYTDPSTGTTSSFRQDPWSEYAGPTTQALTLPASAPSEAPTTGPTDLTIGAVPTALAPTTTHWANGTVTNGSEVDVIIGNFVYTPDYLCYIFGGKAQRLLSTSDATIDWTSLGAYAVKDALTGGGSGWSNGLPNVTRYQGVKMALIAGFIKNSSATDLYYRFLDPTSDLAATTATTTHEEMKNASDTTFGGSDNAASLPSPTNSLGVVGSVLTSQTNRTIRKMVATNLTAETDVLQNRGPRRYDYSLPVLTHNFATFDSSSPDPNLAQPLNYVLADTYRQISTNEYAASRTSACDQVFVLIFPGQGMNDSYASAMKSDVANILVPGNAGGNGNGSGSYDTSNDSVSLAPGSSTNFFAGIISSIAAHGSAGKSGEWGQPWTVTSGGNAVHIQTLTISVGVPGAYHFKNTNAGKVSPHENIFLISQWGDPNRGKAGAAAADQWSQRNGQPANQDLPIQVLEQIVNPPTSVSNRAKVLYWVGSDPQSLASAVSSALGYIVGASAALSAPATPATGVRASNAAYFGIFKTTLDPKQSIQKKPLWSGNLFGMGTKTTTEWVDPLDHTKGTYDLLAFYGYDASGANGQSPADPPVNSKFDLAHLWDSYDIFGDYDPSTLAANSPAVHGGTGLLMGTTKYTHWYERTMYTMVNGAKVSWPQYTKLSATVTDPGAVLTALTTNVYDVDSTTGSLKATKITTAQATAFAAWLRGAPVPGTLTNTGNVYNRQDIMGDIVNSAPLTVELTPAGTDALIPSSPSAAATNPFSTGSASPVSPYTYFDPHARLVIVGTNTGILECFFEWSGSYNSGTKDAANHEIDYLDARALELWSFVPPDMWQAMYRLYVIKDDTTGKLPHRYMVDGDPGLYHEDLPPSDTTKGTLPDTRVSTGENAVVIFGSRKGARSYYGLQISDKAKTIKPDTFKISWIVNPQDPGGSGYLKLASGQTTPSVSDQGLIKTMGMSTSVPAVARFNKGSSALPATPTTLDVILLGGGYSNPEMDARYKAVDSTAYGKGMGKLVLALDPFTGQVYKSWDLRDVTGAVAEGVTPIRLFSSNELFQRFYFADTTGGVWCVNNKMSTIGSTTAAAGYRLDSSYLDDMLTVPRPIYQASKNKDGAGNPLVMRFTTRPDAFRVSGGYPIANTDSVNPLTVMVAIGAGDRNNPTDAAEDYTIGATTTAQKAPTLDRMMVFADRQDSEALNVDSNGGISDSQIQFMAYDGSGWTTTYNDDRVTPGTTTYLFKDHYGYAINLGTGALSSGTTYDKVMVSPLIKQGLLFFSVFDIPNASGFNCSPNSFTRTFRECDIMRPLALNTQTTDLTKVSNIQGSVDKASDSCSGLAFYFNSLSSQLVDAGDRVLQGGALTQGQVASSSINTGTQTARNTPSIQDVKDTDKGKGMKIRAWRVVR